MDRYAVIGNPVEHSQSPFIHARFAEETGEDLRYERLLCPLDGFTRQVTAFADSGAKGCNITVPFKFEAYTLAATRSERAQLAGAANVLRFDAQAWLADNTDGVGLVRDIQDNFGLSLNGKRVLVLGAGGAAAGVLGPLTAARPKELVLANRTLSKAQALVRSHTAWSRQHGVPLSARSLDACGEGFDVLINATASSIAGAEVPVSPQVLARGALALDMMYGAPARGFLDWASAHGALPRDGLGMLVEQAAESFYIWRGVRPHTPQVLNELRQRLGLAA